MSSNNLSHLSRIKCKRSRSRNIYLSTNLNIFWRCVCFVCIWMLSICSWVLQNYIPALWCRNKQLLCFFKVACFNEFLCSCIKSNKSLLLRNCHCQRTDMRLNCTICLILQETKFIDRKNQISLTCSYRR